MSTYFHAETRFVELMSALFQLDEAVSLDFGLYRIIRRHNREVRKFLGEVISERGNKFLRGGKLSEILEDEFAVVDDEVAADDKYRLKKLEKQLGISSHMDLNQLEPELSRLEKIPATSAMAKEYRIRREQMTAGTTAMTDQREVLNRLYQFFDRHYQDGDFIVERRYGRDGSRYIRSTGDDMEFHFATEDMYYIKSGDIFTDFPVTLNHGEQIIFTVEPDTLTKTREILKPTDKAHYEFDSVERKGENTFVLSLKYKKGAQTEKKKDEIVSHVQKACRGDAAEIKRWLNHFIARNQSDFFIHKRLKEVLIDDLDIFIKTEVMDADQLIAGGDLPKRTIKVARVVRRVGSQIIDFLETLEEFQKSLWEKKKLVFDTRYVITLDRIARLAGDEWLASHLEEIITRQKTEWKSLGLGTFQKAEDCREVVPGDLFTAERFRWFPLPVDTGNFDDAFKWKLLAAVSAETPLDEAIDGIAIRSDNWQALNTIQIKYDERVKCIYIDPPYNTKSSGIPYKNGYRDSSWGALMQNRLEKLHQMMKMDGAIFVSIDKTERTLLEHVMDKVYGVSNRVEELVWAMNTTNSQTPNYSTNHEFVEVYVKHRPTAEQDLSMFREPKPGFEEVMELVTRLNPKFPSIKTIEEELRSLYTKHKIEYREYIDSEGLDWEDEKDNDPWRGLYNYSHAEYRDSSGKYIPEDQAESLNAIIWVWQEDNTSMPATKQAESTLNPDHPNYRFYAPKHPKTGEPCSHPKSGWKFAFKDDENSPNKRSFLSLDRDHRIAYGEDEKKVPRIKRMLHEVDTNVGKSVFRDYSDGEKQTSAMFGKSGVFLAPKHTDFVSRFIRQGSKEDSIIIDCFGGSGSTAHAVIRVNRVDKTSRKFITIEVNRYFETLIIPRLKKAAASPSWKGGKAETLNGPGLFMRVQTLEQYEDTLENLDIEFTSQTELPFEDPAFCLRYGLNQSTNSVYCTIDHFRSPFGYRLKRAQGGGEAKSHPVDLAESLIYLIGLDVSRLYREAEGVVITGQDRRGHSVAVFFRDCDHPESEQWTEQKFLAHDAERVFTNDPAALSFQDCHRFESIESLFTLQFGRA